MGSDLGIKPEDISKMTLEVNDDIIGNNYPLSLLSYLSYLSSSLIVAKEMDIFNKKDQSHTHVKILTRISSSLKRLKYMSRDYAYFIAYNIDNGDNESKNNNDDKKRIENDKKFNKNIWKQLIKFKFP